MFNIGWSEYLVIAVIALVAIGPKELPGVLRMVGQWVAKARKMAAEFQGQFHEAMREAEMADLKKSFDEVREAATGFANTNIMTSLQDQASSALGVDENTSTPAETTSSSEQITEPPEDAAASEPLAIAPTGEEPSAASEQHAGITESEAPREAKAS